MSGPDDSHLSGASRGQSFRFDLLPAPGDPQPPVVERPRYARAILLFLLTVATSTTLAPAWLLWTRSDVVSDLDAMLTPGLVARVWSDPVLRGLGLKIALPTLFILLCHEFGHYIACRRYRVQATLPYFLPAPFGFGSLGAFIRIKSPLRSFRELFDVGFSGPAAGFVALLPWLFYGLAHSTPVPLTGAAPHASVAGLESALLVPGRCLAIQLAALPFHGWLPSNVALNLHPFALAAWIGLFATALNLLPLGQLDGGHILYAAIGRRQHRLAWPLWAVLAGLAFYWPGWGLWCGLLLFMGVKHPAVWDESQPLDLRRRWLALSALVLFVLCFMPVPLRTVPLP